MTKHATDAEGPRGHSSGLPTPCDRLGRGSVRAMIGWIVDWPAQVSLFPAEFRPRVIL